MLSVISLSHIYHATNTGEILMFISIIPIPMYLEIASVIDRSKYVEVHFFSPRNCYVGIWLFVIINNY